MNKDKFDYLVEKLTENDKKIISELKYTVSFLREDLLIEQFYLIIDKITFLIQNLHKNIQCHTGCNRCCSEYGLPEVTKSEWELIKEELDNLSAETLEKIKNNLESIDWQLFDKSKPEGSFQCPLLINGKCSVYAYRPFTCRVTGYFLKENTTDLKIFDHGNNLIPLTCSTELERWKHDFNPGEIQKYIYLPVMSKFKEILKQMNYGEEQQKLLILYLK